ncbi:unnamed protein product [Fraxinus pennsylvanica]|uniref:Uncharacterized protein n=1 Tax=Fraxinus pennsylvanica TaxID=56036 RepID=A0AAD2A2Y4_9LAMI|nr:unnamed protein product [Fraxinus pennsylvanica]
MQCMVNGDAVYWETTISSFLDDYRPFEGIMIAHSGRSAVTLFLFGEMAMSHSKTRMEETWTIEEEEREKSTISHAGHQAKVAAVEKIHDSGIDNIVWKMKI